MTHRTIVIGGGVIGLSVAWTLARRGHRVTLYDRDKTGGTTSSSASGTLPPANLQTATDPIDRLRGFSHQQFPEWSRELTEATGIDIGLRQCGGWYLADTAGERAAMQGISQYWNNLEIQCESVSLSDVANREPALARWATRLDAAAWWAPGEFQIRPPRYMEALIKAAQLCGVEIRQPCPVDDLRFTNGVAELSVQEDWIGADSIVLCAGAWTGRIAESLRLQESLIPVRGQILLLKTDEPLLRGVVNFGNRYILVRDDGYTLVGSSEEEVGFQFGTTESILHSLYQFAVEKVPALASAKRIDQWSGLRPMTFDGFPMIGRVPETENLYVAAGHYRSGLHLSPGTAICIADLIDGTEPPVDLDPFGVAKQQHERTSYN